MVVPQSRTTGPTVETESLFGASDASGEEILGSVPEPEVFVPNLRVAGRDFGAVFAA